MPSIPPASTSFSPLQAETSSDLQGSLLWISRLVSGTVLVAAVLVLGGMAYFLWDPIPALHLLGPPGLRLAPIDVHPGMRLALFLALTPALVLFLLTAYSIDRLFLRFRRGKVLDLANARRLTNIGWFLFASAEVAILTRTFVALALTWHNPPGQRQLLISVSINDVLLLLFGLFVLAFGKVLTEATRIADENRRFV